MEIKDEMTDIAQTSKKIENISKKEGLREGISAGRDSNFQESFDKGFEEGFRNGFVLGKYRGILVAESKQTCSNEKRHPLLENISTGSCEICKKRNAAESEEDIDNLIKNQNKIYTTNIQSLASSFEECKMD